MQRKAKEASEEDEALKQAMAHHGKLNPWPDAHTVAIERARAESGERRRSETEKTTQEKQRRHPSPLAKLAMKKNSFDSPLSSPVKKKSGVHSATPAEKLAFKRGMTVPTPSTEVLADEVKNLVTRSRKRRASITHGTVNAAAEGVLAEAEAVVAATEDTAEARRAEKGRQDPAPKEIMMASTGKSRQRRMSFSMRESNSKKHVVFYHPTMEGVAKSM